MEISQAEIMNVLQKKWKKNIYPITISQMNYDSNKMYNKLGAIFSKILLKTFFNIWSKMGLNRCSCSEKQKTKQKVAKNSNEIVIEISARNLGFLNSRFGGNW